MWTGAGGEPVGPFCTTCTQVMPWGMMLPKVSHSNILLSLSLNHKHI